ncbi:hypothetical protein AVEN_197961-1 [Araneus ventricosus]|uniref:Uncharacterized protein n=1 Tax=Araneus ventricosus TaxID=182803 RepID=A0A4Y2HHV1_ARAVE|nr:hypothetical protein AVEN_197961-1 [Araneus ventricosus]
MDEIIQKRSARNEADGLRRSREHLDQCQNTLKSQNIMTTYSITRCASFGLQNSCKSPGFATSFWYMTGDRLYQMSKQRSRKVEIFGHGDV